MMSFYDLDHGGSMGYNEFMKFILPCDNADLRTEVCQRKTYKADIVNGKRLHESVEKTMAEFIERECNCHIKLEMIKRNLHHLPDWNCRAVYNLIDSQKQGYVSHPQIYAFLNADGCEPTDEELIAIVRRIDSSGNGELDFEELRSVFEPIVINMNDIQEVEDQGDHIKPDNELKDENSRPLVNKQNTAPRIH